MKYFSKYKPTKSEAAQNLETLNSGKIAIPKWAVVLGIGSVVLSTVIFIATITVVAMKQRDGLYNETCATRTCAKGLGLKCINKTCLCLENQFYREKCRNLSTYLEPCNKDSHCLESQSLKCKELSKCGCNPYQYWSATDKKCVNRKTYNEACDGDQCKNGLNLACNSKICACTNKSIFYWNGSYCTPKKAYNESCVLTQQCLDSEETTCLNSLCNCKINEYFKVSESKCVSRVGEFETCTLDSMCLSPMFCSIKQGCICPKYNFFNPVTSTCTNQYLVNISCNSDRQCKDSTGLSCKNNKCLCDSPRYTWSSLSFKCLLTYSKSTCKSDMDCNDSEKLICRAHNCNCPNTSLIQMCDCKRNTTNEEYWNGVSCVSAKAYEYPCSADYECKTLSELTVCLAGKCQCSNSSLYFWSGSKCENKKVYNEQCAATYQCLDSQLTQCIGFQCVCSSSEYFNGIKCVPRVGEFTQCSSDGMCLIPMTCNSSQICVCGSNEYFENTTSTCGNKELNLGFCDKDLHCRSDKGLVCRNNKCVCESLNRTWSNLSKKCLLTYAQRFCSNSYDCNDSENLICSSDSCNCPISSTIGMCDCTRKVNNETYWDQTKCLNAKSYGDLCTTDYQCQTITQKTVCSDGFCVCSNTTLEFWNGSECTPKRRYLEQCSDNSHCLGSDLTICLSNLCQCGTGKYYNEIGQKCVSRLTEFALCVNNTMCYEAMTCQSFQCKCTGDSYFLNSSLACYPKKSFNFGCVEEYECSSSKGLSCQNGKCLCSDPLKTWDSTSSVLQCKLTYSQVGCTANSDCNQAENLFCRRDGSSPCGCPSNRTGFICDCKRSSSFEQYWDNSKCVEAKTVNMACNHTYECQTLQELTVCSNNICQCGESGVFVTNKCRFCNFDEFYYNNYCYFFSSITKKASEAESGCDSRGSNSNNDLAIIYNDGVRDFFRSKLTGTARYWINSRVEYYGNEYWKGTWAQKIDQQICPNYRTGSNEYMNFDAGTGCFKNDLSDDSSVLRNFACQRHITLSIS